MVPQSETGRLIAAVTMVCGILVIALPVTILGSNFQETYRMYNTKKATKKIKVNENTIKMSTYLDELRHHKVELSATLKHIRILLQAQTSKDEFQNIWSSIEFVLVNGIDGLEKYLSTLKLEEDNFSNSNFSIERDDNSIDGLGDDFVDKPKGDAEYESVNSKDIRISGDSNPAVSDTDEKESTSKGYGEEEAMGTSNGAELLEDPARQAVMDNPSASP